MKTKASGGVLSASQPWLSPKVLIPVTVVVTGASVMIVEIVGTRLLGPVFGVSLYVWAALLAVTLSSLALGYYVGGALADRFPFPRLLGSVTAASSLVLAIAVLLGRTVLSAALSLGPRVGPLLSATLLFAPCLACLGTIGPIAVRLATTDVRTAGHRVGRIYALSTVSGLISTLAVSFVLIPRFETESILLCTAAALSFVGLLGMVGPMHRTAAAMLTLATLSVSQVDGSRALPPGFRIIERTHSPYSLLEVIEDRERGAQLLRADHSIIGAVSTEDHRRGAFGYVYIVDAIRFARPAARTVLQIGLGTGTLSGIMERRGMVSDVVEIDPAVVRLAERHFGFASRGVVHVEDARTFLNQSSGQYDVIVHDTFTGGTTPSHLFSVEVLGRIRDLLQPDGVLALNFVGFDAGPNSEPTWAVYRTIREVFPHVRLFRSSLSRAKPGAELDNMIFFASNSKMTFDVPRDARFENEFGRRVAMNLTNLEMTSEPPPGPTITDAVNSLARLQIPIADHHFEAMEKLLPRTIWLP